MNGREEWAKFAADNGLTWEEGPPRGHDQHGREYYTLIYGDFEFEQQLKKVLSGERYVIVRMFPHSADPAGKSSATRMRFSSYPQKPA